MPDLLLEVGCEELPASFVARACDDLRTLLESKLSDLGLSSGPSTVYGTPRRLIVSIPGLPQRQEDSEKVVRGPSASAAYDATGQPSKALEGFCRGQGVTTHEVYRDCDYVWVRKMEAGRLTLDVLAELIPDAIASMTFAKTMRWAHHRLRFARPIRWILASLDDQLVPFEIEGVASDLLSRGHRFNHPAPFEASNLGTLLRELRNREVEPDAAVRAQQIRTQVENVSNGLADISESLVVENAYLTEWPQAVLGSFDSKYLELPEPVLVTVMAKHERFFPVRSADGSLDNRFVSIRNGGDSQVVAEGNAWVLNARFNDAKFFYDEDKKHTFADFLEATQGIVFQAELGTVRDRADRLAALAAETARSAGADNQVVELARQAGLYAKADLSTGLVGELDELQGVIGGLYAAREGFPAEVSRAIAHHYVGADDHLVSRCLILADQIDKLAGYLGIGMIPSGSSDPYGLRRAAGIAMELALKWTEGEVHLGELLAFSAKQYALELDAVAVVASAREVMRQRCDTLFPQARPDVLEAVLVEEALVFRPRELASRLQTMEILSQDTAFVQSATRPLNIVAAAEKKGFQATALKAENLDSPEGARLLEAALSIRGTDELAALRAPIDAFFDSTMVMVDDPNVRDARLAMLREVCNVLLRVGDFSKLVISG